MHQKAFSGAEWGGLNLNTKLHPHPVEEPTVKSNDVPMTINCLPVNKSNRFDHADFFSQNITNLVSMVFLFVAGRL